MNSWPLRCPPSSVIRPPATCLPGERSMRPSTLPRLRKDFVRACRLVSSFAGLQRLDQVYIRRGIMKYLLTSAGISNDSIRHALVDLRAKPIAESSPPVLPPAPYPCLPAP